MTTTALFHDLVNNYHFKTCKHLFEYLSRSKWRINRQIIADVDQKDSFFSAPLLGTAFGLVTFSPIPSENENELCLKYFEHGDYTQYHSINTEFQQQQSTFPFSKTFYNIIYEKTVDDNTGYLYDDQSSFGQFLAQHNMIADETGKHWIHFDWYSQPKQPETNIMQQNAFFLQYILDDKILNENAGKFVSNRSISDEGTWIGNLVFDDEDYFVLQYQIIGQDKYHKIITQYFRMKTE